LNYVNKNNFIVVSISVWSYRLESIDRYRSGILIYLVRMMHLLMKRMKKKVVEKERESD